MPIVREPLPEPSDDVIAAAPRVRPRTWVLSAAVVATFAVVIGFLVWPMLLTKSGMAQDWSHHLWFLWRQSVTIGHDHEPSLFLNDGGSIFYPLYGMYGGTIYSIFGGLAAVLGGAPLVAYITSYVLGFTSAYFGWYSIGRLVGLGRWQAQVPGLLFVTSGYYLTLVYARGDWPEFLAVSSIPLLAASAIRVLLADELPLLWAALLVASTIVFFGSHAITMLWGSTALLVGGLALFVAVPAVRRLVTRKGLLRVGALVVPAALVNAWYLFPALAYGKRTAIAASYDYSASLHETHFLVSDGHLFTFSRASIVGDTPDFVLALPVLAIAWVAVAVVLSAIFRDHNAWRRTLWIAVGLGVACALLMTRTSWLLALPRPYTFIQFPYRLETYVLLGLSVAVLAALVLARTWPRPWRDWSLAAIVVVAASCVGAVQQVDGYPRGNRDPGVVEPDRYAIFEPHRQPPFTGGLGDYADATLPVVEPAGIAPSLTFPTDVRHERLAVPVALPPGTLVHTNLGGAPYFVKVQGAKVVGRDGSGHMVLAIGESRRPPQKIVLSRSERLPVASGRVVTRVAVVLLLAMLVVHLARIRRRRKRV